jgi:RNA-directed DNA polymerase
MHLISGQPSMKRELVRIEAVASRENLFEAVQRAAKNKRQRPDVVKYFAQLDENLEALAHRILTGQGPIGEFKVFEVHDPKRRIIHAACFADRVLHHAIFNIIGPTFDRALVDSSYACRTGKGVHSAVLQVQKNLRRFAWFGKLDVASYFSSIPHAKLLQMIETRFKSNEFIALLRSLLRVDHMLEKGLPIGTLSSQYFANAYLTSVDRALLESASVRAHVRYMDDIVWWGDSIEAIKAGYLVAEHMLHDRLGLTIKPSSVQFQRSALGISYCGYRVHQGLILPSKRKLKRYAQFQRASEAQYLVEGESSQAALQTRAMVGEGMLAHTQSYDFRQRFWSHSNRLQNIGVFS